MKTNFESRFWEIDFLRGAAIILMIVSNFVTDLAYFNIANVNTSAGFWWWFARGTASTFLILVGISLTMSYARGRTFGHFLKRGLKIFSWGMAITFVTWIFLGKDLILFGVLHLIGLSIILAYPLIKEKYLGLGIGAAIIAVGLYLKNLAFDFNWLLWLGLIPKNFTSVDYFPIFPWFGTILIGLFLGNALYENYQRKFKIADLSNSPFIKPLSFLGKNSLLIYLIHQPIIIALLYLLLI